MSLSSSSFKTTSKGSKNEKIGLFNVFLRVEVLKCCFDHEDGIFGGTCNRKKLTNIQKGTLCLNRIVLPVLVQKKMRFERSWTIIALRNLIFYFWSNIELTWHECSFMSQITNYKEKIKKKKFWDLI